MERLEPATLELLHPTVVDLVNGPGIEVMELLPPAPGRAHEVRFLEQPQVLGDGLPSHPHLLAELAEREPVRRVEPIEELPAAGIRERLEDLVHARASVDHYASRCLHVKGGFLTADPLPSQAAVAACSTAIT